MVAVGYTLMCEQSPPKQLVDNAVRAEEAGFDLAVMSDHYYPWLEAQGHSPYAWSVLGAVAHATSRIDLMSFVTCPIRRYHPAVVAQKAAAVGLLSDGRFTLGLGAGENLNEHVAGAWPHVRQRHDMFAEATATCCGSSTRRAAPASRGTGRWRSAEAPRRPSVARSCTTSGAGSGSAGRSTPSCPGRSRSPRRASSSARRTSRPRCPADPTSTGTWRRSRRSSTPGFTHVAPVQVGGDSQPAFLDWARDELVPRLKAL